MLRPISVFTSILTRLVSGESQTYRWKPREVVG